MFTWYLHRRANKKSMPTFIWQGLRHNRSLLSLLIALVHCRLVARQTMYLLPWERLTACLTRRLINTVRRQLLLAFHLRFERHWLHMSKGCILLSDAGYPTMPFTDNLYLYKWEDHYYFTWKDHSKLQRCLCGAWYLSVHVQNMPPFSYVDKTSKHSPIQWNHNSPSCLEGSIPKSSELFCFLLSMNAS